MRAFGLIGVVAVLAACAPAKPPEAEAPAAPEAAANHVTIAVDVDGRIFWNGEEVTLEEVKRRTQVISGTQTDLQVTPDQRTKFEDLKRVMDALEPSGRLKQAYMSGGASGEDEP